MPDFSTVVWTTERIYMIDFGRAKSGAPNLRFPDVDATGFRDDAFPGQHGPIVTAMEGQLRVTVRFFRTEISTAAKLFAVSSDPAIVEVTDPAAGKPLGPGRTYDIEFTALKEGRAAIEIRYNFDDGPIIGGIYVQVYKKIVVNMRVHLLKVNGRALPRKFFNKACTTRDQQIERIKELLVDANHIWIPHGIGFVVKDVVDTVWGAAEVPSGSQTPDQTEMEKAAMRTGNRLATAVNVFILPTMDVDGVGVSTARAKLLGFVNPAAPPPPPAVQHFGSGLFLNAAADDPMGNVIAHEMGHYMSLIEKFGGHSTQDQGTIGDHNRDDLISRRRVMYPAGGLITGAPYTWRDNTGYGKEKAGGFFTCRKLPAAQDPGFEESGRARAATAAPDFNAA